jgi:hypothetical protein
MLFNFVCGYSTRLGEPLALSSKLRDSTEREDPIAFISENGVCIGVIIKIDNSITRRHELPSDARSVALCHALLRSF